MRFFFLIFTLLNLQPLIGQYAINLGTSVSPERLISQKIGYTTIEVKYSSPSVKDRKIWGNLVPYDKVWRAGANYATTITFSDNVLINDQDIEKGNYSFFVIPREHKPWVLILNAKAKQWGAFGYEEASDVIRIEVTPESIDHQEQLKYDILSNDGKHGSIELKWEHKKVSISCKTKLKDALLSVLNKNLESAKNNNRWINYLQASEILLNEKMNITTALDWINKSEEYSTLEMEWNPQFYPKNYILGHLYWTKAKVLASNGDLKMAVQYASKVKDIEGQEYYLKKKDDEHIDETTQAWKKH